MTLHRVRFPLTLSAIALSACFACAELFWNINLIDLPLTFLARIEQSKIDDVLTILLLLGLAHFGDRMVNARRQKEKSKAERISAVELTMGTVQEIVGKLVSQLRLLSLEAKDSDSVATRIIESTIDETSGKLKALEDLQLRTEKSK